MHRQLRERLLWQLSCKCGILPPAGQTWYCDSCRPHRAARIAGQSATHMVCNTSVEPFSRYVPNLWLARREPDGNRTRIQCKSFAWHTIDVKHPAPQERRLTAKPGNPRRCVVLSVIDVHAKAALLCHHTQRPIEKHGKKVANSTKARGFAA